MGPAKGQRRLSLCPGPPVATIPFGDLLEEVGSMGTFQIFSVFFLSLPVLFLASHNLVQNFSAATPEHQCRPVQPGNLSQQENLVPLGQDLKPDSCQRFAGWLAPDSNDTVGREVGLEPCLDGWQYDHSTFTSTIVTEVCSEVTSSLSYLFIYCSFLYLFSQSFYGISYLGLQYVPRLKITIKYDH